MGATHQSKLRTDALLETLDCIMMRVRYYEKRKRAVPDRTTAAVIHTVELIKREAKWFGPEEKNELRKILKKYGYEKHV